MKIDIFCHILPQKYKEACLTKAVSPDAAKNLDAAPTLSDLNKRFAIMDRYPDYAQVITLSYPTVEMIANPNDAADLAKLGNDEMAELVSKYPERFIAAVAGLPMNNMDAALKETDRAINDLHFRGVQLFTPINGKPLDSPEFMPLYEKMAHYDLPIWIHPVRLVNTPDYQGEDESKYDIYRIFGWLYETTAAMTRLVFSRVLEKYPNLKFIAHHCGAMVPYSEQRLKNIYDFLEMSVQSKFMRGLTRPPIEYFRMFYADTALNGSTPGLMCGHAFYGPDHILFGTDMPFDNQKGFRTIRTVIESIERMNLSDVDKNKIYEGNAKRIMRLAI